MSTSRTRSGRGWILLAVAIVVVGAVGGTIAATGVAGAQAEAKRRSFEASSAEVTSTLGLAIQHEEDLVISAGALLVDDPLLSTAKFGRWTAQVRAFERYPELLSIVEIRLIPAADLPAFAAWAGRDTAGPFGSGLPFAVLPPGDRPNYCLRGAVANRPGTSGSRPGSDLCAFEGSGEALMTTRDSGQGSQEAVVIPGLGTILGVQVPLYRAGAVPTTVEGRRRAFVGWVGIAVTPKVVLDRALKAHPEVSATIRYRAGSSDVTFGTAKGGAGAETVVTNLHNGWTVKTFGAPIEAGVLANEVAIALLLAGIAVSLLLAILVFVLATGRARAERTVELRTDELRHQAFHDALTGLANRALISDRVEHLLARNRRSGTPCAALFMDLDGFKHVNDTLGHEAGDQLLQAVAARLTGTLRDADTIGRMGGDEFVVLLDGASVDAAPELVAERLLDVMRQPFEFEADHPSLRVTTSIGIAVGDRSSGGDLLRDADFALYEAKGLGKNCCAVFRPDMESTARENIELEFDLGSALEAGEFRLVYQPVYDLDDLSLISVEALLRWDHPTLGEQQPDDFIPVLERNGQIVEVGRWVLSEACRQMAEWHARGSDLAISVNVSARQFDTDRIVEHVREALAESGLTPGSLILEVTETAIMRDPAASGERLRAIKALGPQIAIDDFGTGYSSLAYLQRFPIDSLKIDRAFISQHGDSQESQALVRAIVQLGRDLGLKTLAEGVETTGQLDQLRDDSVDQVQGFLLARPLDAATIEATILGLRASESTDRLAPSGN